MITNTVTNHTAHKTILTFNQIIIWKAMYTFGYPEPFLQCFKLKWNCARKKIKNTHTKKHKSMSTKNKQYKPKRHQDKFKRVVI